nr:MAG TPA: hypothetical protein [Caudoviricetes sp.]
MALSKLQQAVQYNKVHLPRTMAGLATLQPDVSTDGTKQTTTSGAV